MDSIAKDITTTKKHDNVPWEFKVVMSVEKTSAEEEDERDK